MLSWNSTLPNMNAMNSRTELMPWTSEAPLHPCLKNSQRALTNQLEISMKMMATEKTVRKSCFQKVESMHWSPVRWWKIIYLSIEVWTPLFRKGTKLIVRWGYLLEDNVNSHIDEKVAACEHQCPNVDVEWNLAAGLIVEICLSIATIHRSWFIKLKTYHANQMQ